MKYLFIAAILVSSAVLSYAQGHGKVIYWSPDNTLQAVIHPSPENAPQVQPEFILELLTKTNKTICRVAFTSKDLDHGSLLVKALWSPDSKYFVFSTFSSGGHSSWHYPTFCYARSKDAVFELDELAGGPLVDSDFAILNPAVFCSKRLNYEKGKKIAEEPIPVKVDLSRISYKTKLAEQVADGKPPHAEKSQH